MNTGFGESLRTAWGSLLLVVFAAGCSSQDPSFVSNETTNQKPNKSQDAHAGKDNPESEVDNSVIESEPESDGIVQQEDPEEIVIIKATEIATLPWPGVTEKELLSESSAKTYQSSESAEQEVSLSLTDHRQELHFSMSQELNEELKLFVQPHRPQAMDAFTQGASGTVRTENFQQLASGSGVLDLVVVIDNSGSMAEEQLNLSTKLNPLLSYISASDWRLAVVTTDYRNGCVREVINKGDPDIQATFAAAIQAGTRGSGNEEGFRMAVEALKGNCLSAPWVRPSSTVAVLIVSDEDNCSNNGLGCSNKDWNTPAYLTDYLASIRQVGTSARTYGLFWDPATPRSQCNTAASVATQYAAAVANTGGTSGSICDADYSTTLSAISRDIATILESQFALEHIPEPSSEKVYINNVVQTDGYRIIGNILKFNDAPAAGSEIRIEYRYGATPVLSMFQLTKSPVPSSLNIKVNGQPIAASGYTYNSADNKITFNPVPPDNASIQVYFREYISLPRSFQIGQDAVSESIYVSINNIAINSDAFRFDSAGGILTFSAEPPEGARIDVSYQSYGVPVLKYPYVLNSGQRNIMVNDADTGEILTPDFAGSMLTFSPEDFRRGRNITVWDPDWRDSINVIKLPVPPVSIAVTTEKGACDASEFTVNENLVDLQECQAIDDAELVTLKYEFVSIVHSAFAFEREFLQKPHQAQIWRVWIDDSLTTDYEIHDGSVVLNSPPGPGVQIKVQVSLLRGI